MTDERPERDFDAWRTRRRAARVVETVPIFGEDVPVPRDIKADLLWRIDEADTGDLQVVEELIAELYGEGELDRWRKNDVTLEELSVLLVWGRMSAEGDDLTFDEAAESMRRRRQKEREGKAPTNRAQRRAAGKKKPRR